MAPLPNYLLPAIPVEEIHDRLLSCPELKIAGSKNLDASDPDFLAVFRIRFQSWDHELLIHQVSPGEFPDQLTCWIIADSDDFRLWNPLSWAKWKQQHRSGEELAQLLESLIGLKLSIPPLTSSLDQKG